MRAFQSLFASIKFKEAELIYGSGGGKGDSGTVLLGI